MAGAGGTEVGRISIKVSPDTDNFRRDLQNDLAAIERSVEATVTVRADLDSTGVIEQFRLLVTRLQGMARSAITIRPDFDGGFALAQMAALLAQMRAMALLGGPTIRPSTNSSGSSGASTLGSLVSSLGTVGLIASLIAPAMALISGLLATLPALIMALVLPIGALLLGLDGLKEAAKVLEPEFKALKDVMTGAFRNTFTPVFESLRPLLGMFSNIDMGLPKIAQAMAIFSSGIANALTSQKGLANMRTLIHEISVLISGMAPGMHRLTDGFLELAAGVSQHFPDVAKWFNSWADGFANWVDKVTQADEHGVSPLETAMENLGKTMQPIMGMLGDLLSWGFDLLSDPEFGAKMSGFVEDIRSFVNDLLPFLEDLFTGLALLMEQINAAIALFPEDFFYDIPKREEEGRETPAGPIEGTSTAIDEEIQIWKGRWDAFYSWLTSNAESLGYEVGSKIQAGINTVSATMSALGTQISGVWNGVKMAVSGAWDGLVSAAQTAFNSVVSAVTSTAASLVAEVASWPGKITGALGDVGSILVSAGTSLMDGLLAGIKAGLQSVLDFASGIADKIAAVKGPLPYDRKVLKPAGVAMMEGLNDGLNDGLKRVLKTAEGMADQISGAMKTDYEYEIGSRADEYGTMTGSAMNIPIDFAKATGQQFLSDLGISGNGFIPQLLEQGIQYIFQIGSVDEALSIKDREESKQALAIVGRR